MLESFRKEHPEHELHARRHQAAGVRLPAGGQRVARRRASTSASPRRPRSPSARREALLVAGELYESAKATDRALAVYLDYVSQFPEPLETAVETRFKIAGMHKAKGDEASYRDQLREDRASSTRRRDGGRTARIRYLAAQSALVLTEDFYRRFDEVKLVQPFEKNLKEKKRRMDAALDAFGRLVDYEVGDVTAGATFYMAEIYSEFSRALVDSERPGGLKPRRARRSTRRRSKRRRFPFEERAIEVHQKNLELMATGIYNPWIEKSLGRLADADARALREVRGEQRLARVDRPLRVRGAEGHRDARRPAPQPAPSAPRRAPAELRVPAAPDASPDDGRRRRRERAMRPLREHCSRCVAALRGSPPAPRPGRPVPRRRRSAPRAASSSRET